MGDNLATAYPAEQARLRKLLEVYADIGPAGQFGHAVISHVLAEADRASADQDIVEMIRCFVKMQDCE